MYFPIDGFRAVANASTQFHVAFLVVFVAVFVFHHTLSLALEKYPDGMNLPDKRIGYTPKELNAWYDAIGSEGCPIYVRAATVDFIPVMPTYAIFLGSILVYIADKTKRIQQSSPAIKEISVQLAYLPLIAALFDAVETYIQRQGCVIYPAKLTDKQIQLGSFGNMGKWIFLVSSIVLIVVLGSYVGLSPRDCANRKKLKQ